MGGRKAGGVPPAAIPTKVIDADEDTKVDVEESADEDIIRMTVAAVEAFKLNADGILDLAKQSRARGYLSSGNQTVATDTWVKIQLDGETYDNQDEFDPTTNYRFTATKAGYYIVAGAVRYLSPVADKKIWASIYKNGVDTARVEAHVAIADHIAAFVCDTIYLAANDYIELYTRHTFGVNGTVSAYEFSTFLSAHKVS